MAKSKKTSVARRNFLKGAAAGAAALVAKPQPAIAQQTAQKGNATAPIPSNAALEREAPTSEGGRGSEAPGKIIEHPGSDFMVDVIKSLKIDYLGSNPGSTFESLHESLINYGNNQMPEFLTCCHEESAVAMAHGYYKIEGRPMMALLHGTVGLQHAAQNVFERARLQIFLHVGRGQRRLDGVGELLFNGLRHSLRPDHAAPTTTAPTADAVSSRAMTSST